MELNNISDDSMNKSIVSKTATKSNTTNFHCMYHIYLDKFKNEIEKGDEKTIFFISVYDNILNPRPT
jgi:hypothetical protein